MPPIKCVLVGDSAVGKSCLVISYLSENKSPEDLNLLPTVAHIYYNTELTVDHQTIKLAVWDTAGQSAYDIIRPVVYKNADVIMVCFSLVTPGSLESVRTRWLPEMKRCCPEVPFILVGTKLDLRDRQETSERLERESLAPVQRLEGTKMAQETKAFKYLECSALTQERVVEVFNEAVRVVLACRHRRAQMEAPKRFRCNLL